MPYRNEFQEAGKVRVVWHAYSDVDNHAFDAACGSKEANDWNNREHLATNFKERVNCPDCIAKMKGNTQ